MSSIRYRPPDTEILERRLLAADKPGEHLWIATAGWIVANPERAYDNDNPILMDQENLILFPPIGCYKCERPYSGKMSKRRCLGSIDPA